MKTVARHIHTPWLAWLLCVSITPSEARALPFSPVVSPRREAAAAYDEAGEADNTSFANRFGLSGAYTALTSGGDALLRQLRVFAASGTTTEAFQRQVANELHRFLMEEPSLTPEQTLAVVQALAPLNAHKLAREHLTQLMVGKLQTKTNAANNGQPNAASNAASELLSFAARAAALALARSNHPEALAELGQWLRRPNQQAEYAAQALLIARPADLTPLLQASGPVTPLLLRTLRQMRDPRSEPFLRRVIKRASAPVQAEAALALLALDVGETLELAKHWLAQSELAPELLWASTCILFHYRDAQRRQALVRLIDVQPTLALDVAAQYVDVELLVLADHLDKLPSRVERRQALTHLSRVGEPFVPVLMRTLSAAPELAVTAARLLARQATPQAGLALTRYLRATPTAGRSNASSATPHAVAPLAVLGLAAAKTTDGADVAETLSLFERRLGQTSGSERNAIKLGLAALDVKWAHKWLASEDPAEVALAARVIGLHGAPFRAAVSQRLSQFWNHPSTREPWRSARH